MASTQAATPPPGDGGSEAGTTGEGAKEASKAEAATAPATRNSWIPKWLLKDHIVAGDGFNRWWVPPASIATHLCIGSVYAWSMFNAPLTRELGVVASAAGDWSLSSVVPIFSTAIVCLGLSAAVAGKWLEEVGGNGSTQLGPCCVGGACGAGTSGAC